jgi:hypothetical protein
MSNLKERFIDYCDDVFMDKEVNAEQCEKIADDYAIEFAKWIAELEGGNLNLKVLKLILEIYKKEKGL